MDEVVARLEPGIQSLFQSEIFPTRMYPLDALVQFLAVGLELAEEPEEVLTARSEAVIDRQLRGIYRIFVRLGSPEFVLKRIGVVHQTYFEGVTIHGEFQGAGCFVARYHGFEAKHRLVELIIQGFYRKALEISGAKDINVCVEVPLSEGAEYLQLKITWG